MSQKRKNRQEKDDTDLRDSEIKELPGLSDWCQLTENRTVGDGAYVE